MMTTAITPAPTTASEALQAGHDARENHNDHEAALRYYKDGHKLLPSIPELIRLDQASGVSYCALRNYTKAFEALERALRNAVRFGQQHDLLLRGAVERDLGDTHTAQAVWFAEHGEPIKAKKAFNDAELHYMEGIAHLGQAGDKAEMAATLGRWGMSMIDRGDLKEGRAKIKQASRDFRKLEVPHPVYERNNLIVEIRTAPSFKERWAPVPRAWELAGKGRQSIGVRKRIAAALAGNRFHQWAKRHLR